MFFYDLDWLIVCMCSFCNSANYLIEKNPKEDPATEGSLKRPEDDRQDNPYHWGPKGGP